MSGKYTRYYRCGHKWTANVPVRNYNGSEQREESCPQCKSGAMKPGERQD